MGMKALLMPKAKVEHNMELAFAACSAYQSKSLIPERGLNNSVVPGDGPTEAQDLELVHQHLP